MGNKNLNNYQSNPKTQPSFSTPNVPYIIDSKESSPKSKLDYLNLIIGLRDPKKPQILHFDEKTEKIIELNPPLYPIYNYSSLVMLDHEHIYSTGGINKELYEIVKVVYEIKPSLPLKFTKLPLLTICRYTHCSIINKGNLYVVGGRTYGLDDIGILNHCERLNLSNPDKWSPIADMNKPRCTGFVLIYQEQIYAFGGYTGPKKRSRIIERYDETLNQWEILNFKLKEGVEAGSLYPVDLDEFVIVGGNTKSGLSNKSYLYNLQEETINDYSQLTNPRVLQKTFIDYKKANIYVLGGDVGNTCERLSYLQKEKWDLLPMNLDKYGDRDAFKSFGYVSPNLVIYSCSTNKPTIRKEKKQYKGNNNNYDKGKMEEKKEEKIFNFDSHKDNLILFKNKDYLLDNREHNISSENDNRFYLFGTDFEPYIIEYNIATSKSNLLKPQKPLELQCYQSGVKISSKCYFIAGGINSTLNKISNSCFFYMSIDNNAFKLDSMHHPRYTFNLVYQNPWIYVLGGRGYGSDEVGVLNECERYHMEKHYWEDIASLTFKRCTAMAFSWSNGIYIAGGYMGSLKREKRFECYIESINKWEIMGIELIEALEASSFIISENKLLFIGGRLQSGDTDKVWSYDVSNGFDAFHGEKIGNLKLSRCLHKTYQLDKDNFLVLGGTCYDNLFETFGYDREKNLVVNHDASRYEEMRKQLVEHLKKYFKDSSLHKNLLI